MTRYLLMPFRSVPLTLVITFAVLWKMAIFAGITGIPLAIILVSWFFKYCYVLLDTVVAGNDELPVLSVEMLNPVDEQRPLIQAIMFCAGFIACWTLGHAHGAIAGYALAVVLLSALPATVGLLAISDSWLHALSPVAIGRIMKELGVTYLVVLAVVLGGCLLIGVLAALLDSTFLSLILGQLIFMLMFCVIGGSIFDHRVELQLATRSEGERLAEREERDHAAQRAAVLDRSYSLLRLKRRNDAWANLEPWMRKHCPDSHPFTEYHALQEATCSWDDPAIGDRVTDAYLGRLLANGETGMALDALQLRLESNPAFCPTPPAQAKRLTQLAVLGGRRAMSRQLLANAAAQTPSATPPAPVA